MFFSIFADIPLLILLASTVIFLFASVTHHLRQKSEIELLELRLKKQERVTDTYKEVYEWAHGTLKTMCKKCEIKKELKKIKSKTEELEVGALDVIKINTEENEEEYEFPTREIPPSTDR